MTDLKVEINPSFTSHGTFERTLDEELRKHTEHEKRSKKKKKSNKHKKSRNHSSKHYEADYPDRTLMLSSAGGGGLFDARDGGYLYTPSQTKPKFDMEFASPLLDASSGSTRRTTKTSQSDFFSVADDRISLTPETDSFFSAGEDFSHYKSHSDMMMDMSTSTQITSDSSDRKSSNNKKKKSKRSHQRQSSGAVLLDDDDYGYGDEEAGIGHGYEDSLTLDEVFFPVDIFPMPPTGLPDAAELARFEERAQLSSGDNCLDSIPTSEEQGTSLRDSNSRQFDPYYYDDKDIHSFQSNHRRLCIVLIYMLVALAIGGCVGIIVGVVVPASRRSAHAGKGTPEDDESQAFTEQQIFDAAIALSGEKALSTPGSPQRSAATWMSSVDAIGTIRSQTAFAQRYAIVTLFFSLRGDEWLEQASWVDPKTHECDFGPEISCTATNSQARVVNGIIASDNNLQGEIPHEIGLLTHLEFLRIPRNRIGGTIPSSMGHLKRLGVLTLNDNQLSGRIDDSISGLESLSLLDIRNNKFSGSLPRVLMKHETLNIIRVDNNLFTGSLPSLSTTITSKLEFTASYNDLVGNVKFSENESGANATALNLEILDLSFNGLDGAIPPLLAFLPSLRHLDLSGNNLTGTIPAAFPSAGIAAWVGLEFLALASNSLIGNVPVNIALLSHMDISNNRMGGTIPTGLSKMVELEQIRLNDNELTGQVPSDLGSLQKLGVLQLHGNPLLEGSMPMEICDSPDSFQFFNLTVDCASVTCDCCTDCF